MYVRKISAVQYGGQLYSVPLYFIVAVFTFIGYNLIGEYFIIPKCLMSVTNLRKECRNNVAAN
jgi:hypothetical protein